MSFVGLFLRSATTTTPMRTKISTTKPATSGRDPDVPPLLVETLEVTCVRVVGEIVVVTSGGVAKDGNR